jgi:hypothetical protein
MKRYKYRVGNIEAMKMNPSLRMNWEEIQNYLKTFHTYNKGSKEEGWRLPSENEMIYLNNIFNLGVSSIEVGEYWTSDIYSKDSSGEPSSCLVYVFSPFPMYSGRNSIVRSTMSAKLPVILVRDI